MASIATRQAELWRGLFKHKPKWHKHIGGRFWSSPQHTLRGDDEVKDGRKNYDRRPPRWCGEQRRARERRCCDERESGKVRIDGNQKRTRAIAHKHARFIRAGRSPDRQRQMSEQMGGTRVRLCKCVRAQDLTRRGGRPSRASTPPASSPRQRRSL